MPIGPHYYRYVFLCFVSYVFSNYGLQVGILLHSGELLAERCRTDDLLPSIPISCLPPCRMDPKLLGLNILIIIVLSQVVCGCPTDCFCGDRQTHNQRLTITDPQAQQTGNQHIINYV